MTLIGMLHQILNQWTKQKDPSFLVGRGGKDHTLCVCGAPNSCHCSQVRDRCL